jgi:hypothetical protein
MTHSKKKAITNTKSVIVDIKRDGDLFAAAFALQPKFEGILYTSPITSQIDFVNVSDTIGAGQTPA